MEKRLSDNFGSKVKIITGRKKGKIEIEYYGNDDFTRIMEKLGLKHNWKAHRKDDFWRIEYKITSKDKKRLKLRFKREKGEWEKWRKNQSLFGCTV